MNGVAFVFSCIFVRVFLWLGAGGRGSKIHAYRPFSVFVVTHVDVYRSALCNFICIRNQVDSLVVVQCGSIIIEWSWSLDVLRIRFVRISIELGYPSESGFSSRY